MIWELDDVGSGVIFSKSLRGGESEADFPSYQVKMAMKI